MLIKPQDIGCRKRILYVFKILASKIWRSVSYLSLHEGILLKCKGKYKTIPLQAWTSQMVPGGWGSQISWQSAHEVGKVVSLTHRLPLPPGNIPGTHFC
jgi:hypothetical protein